MTVGEFDPVQFGQLIAEVKHTGEKMDETMDMMKSFIDATNRRFENVDGKIGEIEKDAATKKGAILGALGGGAIGGASLTEIIKKLLA